VQTELLSLSKAFNEFLYRIPDYQRGYSWGAKQLKDFWNDLDQLEEKRNHYTGVLTLETVPMDVARKWDDDRWIIEAKHFKPYFIVDGQQRLTTAIILIQVILELTEEGRSLNYDSKDEVKKRYIFQSKDGGISRSYIFGYERDNPSYEYLKTEIFLEQSENHAASEETIYTRNLKNAKDFFSEKIAGYTHEQREALYTKVTQHLLFNVFTIAEDIDVFVTFETMNNRGKPLSHLELLKNRLIYLSTKFPSEPVVDGAGHDKSKLRRTINESWKAAYHYLGKDEKRALSDNQFLLIQYVLYFNVDLPRGKYEVERDTWHIYRMSRGQQDYRDYLLDDVFSPKRLGKGALDDDDDAQAGEVDEGSSEQASRKKKKKQKPLTVKAIYDYALDIKNTVEIYYRVSNPTDSKLSSQEKIYLERLHRLDDDDVLFLLVAAYKIKCSAKDRLALLVQLERIVFVGSIRSYLTSEYDLPRLGILLAGGKISVPEIADQTKLFVEKAVASKEFKEAIANMGKSGYYSWGAMRYFLFEYEQYLRESAKETRHKLSWDDFVAEDYGSDYVTVEHIYPQRAAHASWGKTFNVYAIKERNILKQSIGNFVPLSKRKNSSLGNRPFEEKKGNADRKTGYCFGCYSEIDVSRADDWTPQHIRERSVKLLTFMEERWGFSLGSTAEKIRLLGLDFVKP
jgi:Protein of unknown function DUF262/Protein of unknown function (DUF1524)